VDQAITRLPTGIPELDSVLRGGLLRGRIHLVEGRPGTGKTTIGLRYLIEGAKAGQRCLYVTLSETRQELLATARNHNWSLDGVHISERMPIDDALGHEQSVLLPTDSELSKLVDAIVATVREHNAERVVVDSMAEIRLLAQDSSHYRRQIIQLRHQLSELSATILLLDDLTSEEREYELQSAVHGVLCLEMRERTFGSARRTLRVTKLRGGDFQSGWHDFAINTGEVLVFPSLIAEEHSRPHVRTELLSGSPGLDALFGGGLGSGTSTMIVGPSGVGKSTLALQYALSMIRSGEKASYFTFDETEITLRSRMINHMGSDHGQADPPGFLITRINPSRISPGAFIWRVRRHVEDHGVRLVIIDSINSYLDVIREERAMLLQMNELFLYLANMGVMSIVIGAHSADLDTSREPDALSLMTDNMISLRFYEHQGDVHKAISVLKKRHGEHSHQIRAFRLTEDGVEVGEKITSVDNLMAGVIGAV
jgi:circadian clock protein KaiC